MEKLMYYIDIKHTQPNHHNHR